MAEVNLGAKRGRSGSPTGLALGAWTRCRRRAARAPAQITSPDTGDEAFESWQEARCLAWLDELGRRTPLLAAAGPAARRAAAADGSSVTGAGLLAALESTRELRDTFGLHSSEARCAFERAVRLEAAAARPSDCLQGTSGALFTSAWLDAVRPLYRLHMGTENMAPLLYTLVRFVKPRRLLEIGAGYTSLFLLQALRDNAAELDALDRMRRAGPVCCGEAPWLLEAYFSPGHSRGADADVEGLPTPLLRCVDNLTHPGTTAGLVEDAAARLGLTPFLALEVADAYSFDEALPPEEAIDFLWVDFGAKDRLDDLFRRYWPRLRPGGLAVVHSTLTNRATRIWLEAMRSRAEIGNGTFGEFETLSFLEPHKMFQNSCSVFQRRGPHFVEPILTPLP